MATLLLMVRRSLRQHLLSTAVTVAACALGSGLVLAVFAIQAQSERAFHVGALGFDAVLGARGSALQLVLNAVFHLETSPGNLPWSVYRAIAEDPNVELAIPYAVGDNYRGFRIVGTTAQLFDGFVWDGTQGFAFAQGRLFDPARREAVIGSFAARKLGLQAGDVFHPYHGLVFDESMQHAEEFLIAGVLAATNTPADRAIWIPLDAVYRMSGHVLRGDGQAFTASENGEIDDAHKEVSAVMLRFHSPQAGFLLDQTINKQGTVATLAWPIGRVLADFFERLGWMSRVLALVAYLVVVVAAGGVLASLYNTMNERRRELAILRSLGARRRTLFAAIVLESSAIGALGALLGFGVYAAVFSVAASIVRAQTGVVLDLLSFHPVLIAGPLGMIALSALAGVVPAWKAYRTDVATGLVPAS